MRLTKDLHTPHDDTTYSDIIINAIDREQIVLTKLKHYENIEEELGIDLIILLKAKKDGIYAVAGYGKDKYIVYIEEPCWRLRQKGGILDFSIMRYDVERPLKIKDYGKTWALTREELE